MKRADIEKKVEMIAGKSGKELRQTKSTEVLRICLDPRDLNKAIKREYYQLPTFEEIASRLNVAKLFMKLDAKKRILGDNN